MTKDIIYREDALNALLRMDGTKIDKALAMGEIRSIPSADRPQGWVDKAISIIDEMEREGVIDYGQAWEFRMRARMRGADDE